jgi:hypothetical protein
MTCRDKLLALRAKKGVDQEVSKVSKAPFDTFDTSPPAAIFNEGPFWVIQPLMERYPPGSLNGIAPSAARRERRPAPS